MENNCGQRLSQTVGRRSTHLCGHKITLALDQKRLKSGKLLIRCFDFLGAKAQHFGEISRSKQRFNPSNELTIMKWLAQVIVSSKRQPLHPTLYVINRCKKKYGASHI